MVLLMALDVSEGGATNSNTAFNRTVHLTKMMPSYGQELLTVATDWLQLSVTTTAATMITMNQQCRNEPIPLVIAIKSQKRGCVSMKCQKKRHEEDPQPNTALTQ